MLDPTLRTYINSKPWDYKNTPSIEGALTKAIEALIIQDTPEQDQVAKVLMAILDQQGCEHLDCGPDSDGRLTDAISVIVFG